MVNNIFLVIWQRLYLTWLRLKKEELILINMGLSRKQIKRLIAHGFHHRLLHERLSHLVWQTAKLKQISPKEAGKRLSTGLYWNEWKTQININRRVK